jgi:chromosome segregation ATPase
MRNKNKNSRAINCKNQNNVGKNKFNNNQKKSGSNPQQQKKVTNYNIININNNNNNTSIMSNTNNFMNSSNNNNGINNEGISSIKFNNNILSTELLNLNKEFNKLKSENKSIVDKNNKFEKEKKDILEKLKNKTEACEKFKKENAELIILINNSKYKNIIETENENKKLKMTLEQIDKEIQNMKVINEKNEQKIKDQNIQLEKMKSIITKYNSFKEQKDNLLLANAKYETEIKRLKYNLEQERDLSEKAKMLLKNNEEQIDKLNKEVSFYSFHINKYKSDAAKALEDAVEYQQIVSALQSQVNEYKIALNKIKQNKKI